jgi:hypothetical protein
MVHVFLLSAEEAHPCFQILSYPLHSPPFPTTQIQSVWRLRCRLDDRRMELRCSDNSRDICLYLRAQTGSEVQIIGEFLPHWQSAWCTNLSLTHGAALTFSHTFWWSGA